MQTLTTDYTVLFSYIKQIKTYRNLFFSFSLFKLFQLTNVYYHKFLLYTNSSMIAVTSPASKISKSSLRIIPSASALCFTDFPSTYNFQHHSSDHQIQFHQFCHFSKPPSLLLFSLLQGILQPF